jgi:mannose-1-phosphate guanylyltransferase
MILAGGSGTRLWPLSRRNNPKQLLSLVSGDSMYRITIERLSPLIPRERIYVVTNPEMAELLREREPLIPDANYVIEPSPKDSGPAAALGMAHIHHRDPSATVALLSSDHYIGKIDDFQRTLKAASQVAQDGSIVTLGITPSFPSTGFGYVERGELLGSFHGLSAYRTVTFAEKPSLEIAQQWIQDGKHSWNAGMFVMMCSTALHEYQRQQPAFGVALGELEQAIGSEKFGSVLTQVWDIVPKKSFDFAIMEGAERLSVIPVDIDWSDIGTWASLMDVLPTDVNGNVIIGDHIGIDTHNSLVRGDKRLIATIGLTNCVIVDTPDVLLVCPMDRVQDVKTIVESLRARHRQDVL